MSENKYSVVIQAKSGDRVLTETKYPGQSYSELVSTQHLIAKGLLRGGVAMAELIGDPVPEQLAKEING
jgi:hypothetical protein